MSAQWASEIIGILHANHIKQIEFAAYMGLTKEYVNMVLNGKRVPQNAEQKFREALNELIKEKSK